MWPFKKKKEELEEIKMPFREPGMQKDFPEQKIDEKALMMTKLEVIIAKLENIEQRLRNLEK